MSKFKSPIDGTIVETATEQAAEKSVPGFSIREESDKEILNGIFQAGKEAYLASLPEGEKMLQKLVRGSVASMERKLKKSLGTK